MPVVNPVAESKIREVALVATTASGERVRILADDDGKLATTATGGAGPGGGLTDAELRASSVQVTVDNFPGPDESGLTDAQLRANPVPVTGVVGAVCSGAVSVDNFPAFPSSFAVSNFPAATGLTDAQIRETPLPVSGAVTATCSGTVGISGSVAVTGPLTDAQLRAAAVPVSGSVSATCSGTVAVSNFPSSQAVTGPLTDAQLRATAVPVSGSVNATCYGTVNVGNFPSSQAVTGPLTDAQLRATPVPVSGSLSVAPQTSPLAVSSTGTANNALTATLPAAGAGQFHYLTSIVITRYATAAVTGTSTPVDVTTTNLPGSLGWTLARAAAIGTTEVQTLAPAAPLKSSVANTNTTIVCPAVTGFRWRVTVAYYTTT